MSVEFPLYLMKVNEQKLFVSIQKADVLMDSWFDRVTCCGLVLNQDFTVREITEEEKIEYNTLLMNIVRSSDRG